MNTQRHVISYLVIALACLLACQTTAYADAWQEYLDIKAQHRQQNQDLWQQYRDGDISADELQDEWERMDEEAHDAAEQAHQEMKEKLDESHALGRDIAEYPAPHSDNA